MTYAGNEGRTGRRLTLAVSCALASIMTLGAGVAAAQGAPAKDAYLVDQRGEVARSGFGLCWRTGFWTPAQAIEECDPDLVMKPAALLDEPPAVAPPVAAAKPEPQHVRLNADTLFDFDKATLRPDGRQVLDDLVDKLRDIAPDAILVIGHTDRIGSAAYNQRLSERRAASVKTYLVDKGIDADRVRTEGRGKTQPVTQPGECRGPKSAKVIACLQPDRRVDIEITGMRAGR